ncbi:MAG: PAS domain-containing protein, partial [Chloroflexota bacterium]
MTEVVIEHVGGRDIAGGVPLEMRERLAAILDSVADGVTVQDPSGRIVYANDAALAMMGLATLDDLLTEP